MKRLIFPLISLLIIGCSTIKEFGNPKINPTSSDELIGFPFGHNESIAAYKSNLPKKTKVVKMVQRNIHYPNRVDTIYSFNYKKSKIAVVKTYFNKEMVLGGNVENKEIILKNGVQVGMQWDDFVLAFTNFNENYSDTVAFKNETRKRKITFYFDKNKTLKRYTFNEYID
jgi:hypothetical protein